MIGNRYKFLKEVSGDNLSTLSIVVDEEENREVFLRSFKEKIKHR